MKVATFAALKYQPNRSKPEKVETMAKEESESVFGWLVTIALALIIFVWIGSIGYSEGRKQVEREAVVAGVADWINDEDGRPVFSWLGPKE